MIHQAVVQAAIASDDHPVDAAEQAPFFPTLGDQELHLSAEHEAVNPVRRCAHRLTSAMSSVPVKGGCSFATTLAEYLAASESAPTKRGCSPAPAG